MRLILFCGSLFRRLSAHSNVRNLSHSPPDRHRVRNVDRVLSFVTDLSLLDNLYFKKYCTVPIQCTDEKTRKQHTGYRCFRLNRICVPICDERKQKVKQTNRKATTLYKASHLERARQWFNNVEWMSGMQNRKKERKLYWCVGIELEWFAFNEVFCFTIFQRCSMCGIHVNLFILV